MGMRLTWDYTYTLYLPGELGVYWKYFHIELWPTWNKSLFSYKRFRYDGMITRSLSLFGIVFQYGSDYMWVDEDEQELWIKYYAKYEAYNRKNK